MTSRRQTCNALSTELNVLLAEFAQKHGLALTPVRGSYRTTGQEQYLFKIELNEAGDDVVEGGLADAVAATVARGLMARDPLAYPKGAGEVLEAAGRAGRLFKFGAEIFGPITGWNSRAPKSPLQFNEVSASGEPTGRTRPFKTRDFRADTIGIPASFSPALDVQVGDPCYVDYEGSDEEGDEQGYYGATIISLDKDEATVKYGNGVEGPVAFDRLIIRPRFI